MEDLSDLTYDLEDDGQEVRRELGRRVWEQGGWATALFHVEELDRKTGAWRRRAALVRFRKQHGAWKRHAAINLSAAVAHALGEALAGWFPAADGDASDDGE